MNLDNLHLVLRTKEGKTFAVAAENVSVELFRTDETLNLAQDLREAEVTAYQVHEGGTTYVWPHYGNLLADDAEPPPDLLENARAAINGEL